MKKPKVDCEIGRVQEEFTEYRCKVGKKRYRLIQNQVGKPDYFIIKGRSIDACMNEKDLWKITPEIHEFFYGPIPKRKKKLRKSR
jgi:hypothetical protein